MDAAGNAYVAGYTDALDFPTSAYAFKEVPGYPYGGDAFVTKMNPAGSALVYSTYLGGVGDFANGIAVDAGNVYVTGYGGTSSPVTGNAFQKVNPDPKYSSAFLTQLNPEGSGLLYSTYIGGSGSDSVTAIAVDASGQSYIAGNAGSTNFPVTENAYQRLNKAAPAGSNAFVAKFHLNIIDFSGGFAQAQGPLGTMQFNGDTILDGYGPALVLQGVASAFNSIPVNIQSFNTDFDFQLTSLSNPLADGITFTVQNIGDTAVGSFGEALVMPASARAWRSSSTLTTTRARGRTRPASTSTAPCRPSRRLTD